MDVNVSLLPVCLSVCQSIDVTQNWNGGIAAKRDGRTMERGNEPTDGEREREREREYGSQGGRAGGAQKIGNIRDDGIVPPFSRCVLAPSSFGLRGHGTAI